MSEEKYRTYKEKTQKHFTEGKKVRKNSKPRQTYTSEGKRNSKASTAVEKIRE